MSKGELQLFRLVGMGKKLLGLLEGDLEVSLPIG